MQEKAKDLIKRYSMQQHIENGAFIERHYACDTTGRASSGSIYYYVSPCERTEFHRIDCDEYWCYNAGDDLELWSFDKDGVLHRQLLGTGEGAEPVAYFARGEIFASRLPAKCTDGTFVTCITVPRFSYDGFELIEKEKMIEMYPESALFWTD